MAKIYFTSDLHFSHKLMLRLYGDTTRPYADTDEMDRALIEIWNETVRDEDIVYDLGDFSMCGSERTQKILRQLRGRHYLVTGNHDEHFCSGKFDEYLAGRSEYLFLKPQNFVLFHYPIFEWDGFYSGAAHLYGHKHDKDAALKGRALNVCFDRHGRLLELDEVISMLDKFKDEK